MTVIADRVMAKKDMTSRLKILLVANYLPDRQYSMLRFSSMLAEQLAQDHDITLLHPQPLFGGLPIKSPGAQKWLGYVDKFLVFPWKLLLRSFTANIVHICDHSNAMYVPWIRHRPHLVTCHDVLAIRCARGEFPQHRLGLSGRIFQKLILGGLRRARRIVCDSPATAQDLVALGGFAAKQPSVIGLYCVLAPLAPKPSADLLATIGISDTEHFFLHVGSDLWYKNRGAVLAIFAKLKASGHSDAKLVFAGPRIPASDIEQMAGADIAGDILFVSHVRDEMLRALYSRAYALIFPSYVEGFGWPVLEAQACGCPVFASDRGSVPWVGGDAARYFDPDDADAAARLINESRDSLPQMQEAGYANLSRFTPEIMTEAYLANYRAAITEFTSVR